MTSSSVPVYESSEPSCVPLMQGRQHNTARPRHNFPILPLLCSKLLISEASYIMDYAMCFSVVYFSGPCTLMGLGAGCWWRRLLLTFTCSWKEPPAPLLLLGSVRIKPKQANGWLRWRDHRHDPHVSQKGLEKTGDTCRWRNLFVSYCTAWVLLSLDIVFCFECYSFENSKVKKDLQAIWSDIFMNWTHTVCFDLKLLFKMKFK